MYMEQKWKKDSHWTDVIHESMANIGHQYGLRIFASKSRCQGADGAEWLHDHHWRAANDDNELIRIIVAMEIEWGFGGSTIFEKIMEDFLKLVQARADLRVMVFQGNKISSVTDKLIDKASNFEGTQQGDRWLFAGWGWDTDKMHCRLGSA